MTTRAPRRSPALLLSLGVVLAQGACSSTPRSADAGTTLDAGLASDGGDTTVVLFNGRDLTGWDLFLGTTGETAPDGGLVERDPRAIFSVVTIDNEPAIRISGQTWGALISREEYDAFELTLEYRWGSAIYPPLGFRDSGVMYWSVGAPGAVNAGGGALADPPGSGGFMISVESQIAGNDVGTTYALGPISFRTVRHTPQPELPIGQWNELRIVAGADRSEHRLNGRTVSEQAELVLTLPGEAPRALTRGKLQMQSEGAEIFFRRIKIRRLP